MRAHGENEKLRKRVFELWYAAAGRILHWGPQEGQGQHSVMELSLLDLPLGPLG